MKNTSIYSALKASATIRQDSLGNEFFEIPSYSSPSTEYWIAAKQYAEKTLKPMISTGRTAMLNVGMGYDATTNDDLIQDAIVKFVSKYSYFVSKFNEINSSTNSQEEKATEFNRIVSTTIYSYLADLWRKISEETEYEDYDSEGNKITKVGKGLRGTHSSISLFSNQNKSANGPEDEVALVDCIAASGISALEMVESSDFIKDCISQLIEVPRQMQGFMAIYTNFSSNDILRMIKNGSSNKNIFNYILNLFSFQYECPELLDLFTDRYSESQLTYTGSMDMKKVLDNERSFGKKKVKSFIEKNHLR